MKLKIDKEFESKCLPLASQEYELLEANIIKDDRVRNPIVTWNGIIVDGHNRYKIARKHRIEFKTIEMEFKDRREVIDWIIKNQFGGRNSSSIEKQYLIYEAYDNAKLQHGGARSRSSSGKSYHLKTAEKIAKEFQCI